MAENDFEFNQDQDFSRNFMFGGRNQFQDDFAQRQQDEELKTM